MSEPITAPDPRRWVTLAVVVVTALIVVLDNSVLTVAIPTILRDFDTTLPAVEWVITGYALTFASLLIIGGRLGDVYGHRRIFVIGAALFCGGSLLAALSWNIPSLIVGEALIEGIGASLMLPTTLSILSTTFQGRERATAFGAWGATVGVGLALGPVVGGILTTNATWRWAFGINVIVAPLAIVGALVFIARDRPAAKRISIDVPGACLVAVGLFLFVFALSEGARYGWFRPLETFTIAGAEVWPDDRAVSFIPLVMVIAVAILFAFYKLERWKERHDLSPLFEFGAAPPPRVPLRPGHVERAGHGSDGHVLRASRLPPGRQAPQRRDQRLLDVAVRRVHDHRVAARRLSHPAPRHRRASCSSGLVLEMVGLVVLAFVVDPGMSFVDLLLP